MITGEVDRYAKTDCGTSPNVQGAREAVGKLEPALSEADPERLAR